MTEKEKLLFEVKCPKCQHTFGLSGDDVNCGLVIGSCDSGGVYSIKIICPKCTHKQDFW